MRGGRTTALVRRRHTAARALLVPLVVGASGCLVDATWTPQTVEPVVDPVADRFMLADVACPAEGACVAVGTLGTLPNATEPVVLRQVGPAWERVDVPPVVPTVRGVSCAGIDDCVVLGPVDLRYRGGELGIMPQPPRDGLSVEAALDCVPGGGCLQVDGGTSAWWDGTAWSSPVGLPTGMMREDPQLSCTSATSCLLVATEPGIEGWPTPGTVTSTTWDGTAWSPIVTLDHRTRPLDLDCAATACFATAGVRADYWTHLLPPVPAEVLRWDGGGGGWTVVPITYPGGAVPTEPGTVSCSSATTCTVLSVAGAGTPPSPTVVAQWDGTAWTGAATDAASPATALACTSPASCVSTGSGVAQHYDGATWSDAELPGGTSPAEVFTAVSCAAQDDCVAVGAAWTLRDPAQGPLRTPTVQRFDGSGGGTGAWVAEDPGANELRHVSCATTSSCMAAGSDLGTFWSRHWDGDVWQDLPRVTDQRAGGVTGLSCPAADWCLLTTTSFTSNGEVAWVWSGGDAWTELAPLPAPTGTTTGLSCPAPGDCVAVANWIGPQAFRLAGGTWAPIDLQPLGLDRLANVDDVDCAAPGSCALVGTNGYVDSRPQALLAVLSGDTWSLAERAGVSAIDVDCWSPTGCVAATSGDLPHLELWTGTHWRPIQNPPGLAHPTTLSCPTPAHCKVTGTFTTTPTRAAIATVTLDIDLARCRASVVHYVDRIGDAHGPPQQRPVRCRDDASPGTESFRSSPG